MAIALVQSALGGNNSGTITGPGSFVSCTGNFGSNTTSGSLLVGVIYVSCPSTTGTFGNLAFSVTTPGVTWNATVFQGLWSTSAFGLAQIFFVQNAPAVSSGTASTFKVTQVSGAAGSTPTVVECVLFEFSGVATSGSPIDASNAKTTQSGGTPNTNNLTTSKSDLILSAFNGNSGFLSAGAGYTLGPNPAVVQFGQIQYQLNSSVGSNSTAFSGGTETTWGCAAVAFKPLPGPTLGVRLNQLALLIMAPAVSPCVVTYSQMVTDLALRLADTNLIFWTKAELQLYLLEALRTWNALTEIWITALSFTSGATPVWYDISTLAGSPRLRTVQDTDLYTVMQYHLLEPASGGTWTGTSQFTITDLQGALQRRRDEVIQLTACNVAQLAPAYSGGIRTNLPNTLLEVVRARFVPSTGSPITLTREDTQAFDHFNPGHLQSTALPTSFSLIAEPPLSLDLDTAPTSAAVFDLIGVQSGPTFNPPNGTLLGVPNDWSWVAKWGALADLLSRESEATDRLRADYCFKRYMDGIKIMQASNWLVSATIAGVPCDTPSISEMDAFANEWENDSSVWPVVVTAGIDFVAPAPSGTSANVVLNIIGNAPLPSLDGDCVSVLRDHYDAILDYAQVLACFKMGGVEFSATQELEKKFFLAAQDQNKRLRSLGLYSDVLHQEGRRQVIKQPRLFDTR